MNLASASAERLRFLLRVTARQAAHLKQTDQRLFELPMSVAVLSELDRDAALAERVEAFVSRFSRLQDTLGDKLLPALLAAAGEAPRTAIENLDRAEKLGWVVSSDQWMSLRKLRNQMVHEYVEDLAILADALHVGHEAVPTLCQVAAVLANEAERLMGR